MKTVKPNPPAARGMRTRLSSPLTVPVQNFMAAAFVVIALVEFSGLLGFEWKRSGWTFTPAVDAARGVYLLAGLVAFYWVWQCAELKCVTMDLDYLTCRTGETRFRFRSRTSRT